MQHDGTAVRHPFLQQACASAFSLPAAGIAQTPFVETERNVSAKRKKVRRR
jgi:hypothetical protein